MLYKIKYSTSWSGISVLWKTFWNFFNILWFFPIDPNPEAFTLQTKKSDSDTLPSETDRLHEKIMIKSLVQWQEQWPPFY